MGRGMGDFAEGLESVFKNQRRLGGILGLSVGLVAVSPVSAQFCAETMTPLSSLGVPAGCDQCEFTRLPGGPIFTGTGSRTTLISDLPEAFCTNGVLYSTLPVLPPDNNNNPPLSLRTQTSPNGFNFVRGDFDIFLFHLISNANCSPAISDKRIVIYVTNEGTGPITVDAKQVIVTDGIIATVHEMERTLGAREMAEDWDTTAVGRIQTIQPGQGAVVAYSKRFRSSLNNLDRSTNINCFGRVRAAVSNSDEANHPTQMHVSVIAIDGTVPVDSTSLANAAASLMGQGARSGETFIDMNTAPSGCQTRRAVGAYETFLWHTAPGQLTVDSNILTTRTFQMGLWQVASGGCPTAQQSIPLSLYPGFTRPDTVGNYHVDYRVNLRLVNRNPTEATVTDLGFGKANAPIGLGWQVVQTPGDQPFATTATLLAAPVRTAFAGPNRGALVRSFLASDGGPITIPPCGAVNVSLRFMILGNSSLPFQIHLTPLQPPPSDIIVDNADSNTSSTGSWGTSANPGFWATNSRFAFTRNGPSVFSWRANLPQEGFYDVYAWWVTGSNRPTAAPFRIHAFDGVRTIFVNQTGGANQWNYLGRFGFLGGNSWVDVSDIGLPQTNPETAVSADAVRFVYRTPLPVTLSDFSLEN